MRTFQFFQPWSVFLQVSILLLQGAAHPFMGEPVEFLACQAAVSHLKDKEHDLEVVQHGDLMA